MPANAAAPAAEDLAASVELEPLDGGEEAIADEELVRASLSRKLRRGRRSHDMSTCCARCWHQRVRVVGSLALGAAGIVMILGALELTELAIERQELMEEAEANRGHPTGESLLSPPPSPSPPP